MTDKINLLEEAQTVVAKICDAFDCEAPQIEYDMPLDLGSRMGQAKRVRKGVYEVSFNPHLFVRTSVADMLETVHHEVAHVMDDVIVGQLGHGPSWKMVMKFLGYKNPRVCHSVNTAGFKSRQDLGQVECSVCLRVLGVTLRQKDRLMRGKQIQKVCPCGGELRIKT